MNRRERLTATLRGEPVDRPAVNFYEINGFEDIENKDPFNIFSHPSWKPVIELAGKRTDRIVMCFPKWENAPPDPVAELTETDSERDRNGSLHTTARIKAGGRILTCRTRRDPDVNTVWIVEHLLKDIEDAEAWLALPQRPVGGRPDIEEVIGIEKALGDSGIVMLDIADPLCCSAALFHMELFTIIAMTEQPLFHRIMERYAAGMLPRIEAVAHALPGRLWRICGPEYASPPYLPPSLFHDYVVGYDKQIVDVIQRNGGYARIHSHGRLRDVLDQIAATGCSGLDPIEPPPQGDVELSYVRKKYGGQLVLFGNIEASDIENLTQDQFAKKVETALRQGTEGAGRGFVLMPSACPYGRVLSKRAVMNYHKMVQLAENA